jgi:hypothetical protein
MLTFCSIVPPAARAQARVMAASVRRHHPYARIVAISLGADGAGEEVPYESLEIDGDASIPSLLGRALVDADIAIYLDPEIYVYDSLEPVLGAARERGVALVPRLTALPEDDERPNYSDLLEAGMMSPACVGARRGEAPDQFLRWWSRRLEDSASANGRWLDLAPDRFPFVASVRDDGCNVSFWNLHERPLERRGDRILAAGSPLRFIHFAGFRPDRPYWLSEDATRVRVIDDPVLAEICGAYAEEVRDAGWEVPRRQIGDVQRLGNGQRVDHLVRALWEEALTEGRDFGDPLALDGATALVGWLREPVAGGAGASVNRYLMAAYLTRPDLQAAFPDLDGSDARGLLKWGRAHTEEVLRELVEPLGTGDDDPPAAAGLGVNVVGYLGETLGLGEAARLYIRALEAAGVSVSTTAVSPDEPPAAGKRAVNRAGSAERQPCMPQRRPSRRAGPPRGPRGAPGASDHRSVGLGDRRLAAQLEPGI